MSSIFLKQSEVEDLVERSLELFENEEKVSHDFGLLLRRLVSDLNGHENLSFLDWFDRVLVEPLLEQIDSSVSNKVIQERCIFLSGKAGQGKSTILRHLFLLLSEEKKTTDERRRPNFNPRTDKRLHEFIRQIRNSRNYCQLRNIISDEISLDTIVKENRVQLYFIDGLDEAKPEAIAWLSELIRKDQNSFFLISSRTRGSLANEEVIGLTTLLKEIGGTKNDYNIGRLDYMNSSEKQWMLKVIEHQYPEKNLHRLRTLVANDSEILKGPADFHLMFSYPESSLFQHMLHSARWLMNREKNKTSEREQSADDLEYSFVELLSCGEIDFANDRLLLEDIGEEFNKPLETLLLFNLIEMEGPSNSELSRYRKWWFDLTNPWSCGILLHWIMLGEGPPRKHSEISSLLSESQLEWPPKNVKMFNEMLKCSLSNHPSSSRVMITSLFNHFHLQGALFEQDLGLPLEHIKSNLAGWIERTLLLVDSAHPYSDTPAESSRIRLNPGLLDRIQMGASEEKNLFLIIKDKGSEITEAEVESIQKWFNERFPTWQQLLDRLSEVGPAGGLQESYLLHLFQMIFDFAKIIISFKGDIHYDESFGIIGPTRIGMVEDLKTAKAYNIRLKIGESILALQEFTHDKKVQLLTVNDRITATWLTKRPVFLDNDLLRFASIVKTNRSPRLDLGHNILFASQATESIQLIDRYVEAILHDSLNKFNLYQFPNKASADQLSRGSINCIRISKIIGKNHSLLPSKLKMIASSLVCMSRIGHLNGPITIGYGRRRTILTDSNVASDIRNFLLKYPEAPFSGIINGYLPQQMDILGLDELPPWPPGAAMLMNGRTDRDIVLKYNESMKELSELPYVWSNGTLENKFTLCPPKLPKPKVVQQYLLDSEKKWGGDEWIAERYAFYLWMMPEFDLGFREEVRLKARESVFHWLDKKGPLFAMILAIRCGFTDISSALIATETNEAGMEENYSTLVGRYMLRRSIIPERYDYVFPDFALERARIEVSKIKSKSASALFFKNKLEAILDSTKSIWEITKFREVEDEELSKKQFIKKYSKNNSGEPRDVEKVDWEKWNDSKRRKVDGEWLDLDNFEKKYSYHSIENLFLHKPFFVKFTSEGEEKKYSNSYEVHLRNVISQFRKHEVDIPKIVRLFLNYENNASMRKILYSGDFEKQVEESDLQGWYFSSTGGVAHEFLTHASFDHHLLPAYNFRIEASRQKDFVKIFGEEIELHRTRKHDKDIPARLSGGRCSIKRSLRDSSRENKPEWQAQSSNLSLLPPGCRSLIEKINQDKGSESEIETTIKLSAVKSSALARAVMSSPIKGKSSIAKVTLKNSRWRLADVMDNEIYGRTVGFLELGERIEKWISWDGWKIDDIRAVIEWIPHSFTSGEQRPVVDCAIFVNDDPGPRDASEVWAEEISKQILEKGKEPEVGNRVGRFWGFITDTGMPDLDRIKQVEDKITTIDSKVDEFEAGGVPQGCRTAIIDLMRVLKQTFGNVLWTPKYCNLFARIKKNVNTLIGRIEVVERESLGFNSDLTLADNRILQGLITWLSVEQEKNVKQVEELFEEIMAISENSAESEGLRERLEDLDSRLRKFSTCFTQEQRESLKGVLKDNVNQKIKQLKKRLIERKIRIRMLGLDTEEYPWDYVVEWNEVLGRLSEPDSELMCVGSLVRFDLKMKRSAGVKTLFLANVMHAGDELNLDGSLKPGLLPVKENGLTNSFLTIEQVESIDKGLNTRVGDVQIFIKSRGYAFHPSLDFEIPIFNSNEEMPSGWTVTSIDARRDRKTGLLRWYVVNNSDE